MKNYLFPLFILPALSILCAFGLKNTAEWNIKSDYSVAFEGNRVSGVFEQFEGKIQFDSLQLDQSSFDLQVKTSSIETGKDLMNTHAKSEDWLDAENHPIIRFQAVKFKKRGELFIAYGSLTLHGITQEIAIPFTFKNNVIETKFEIKRSDFNIGATTGLSKNVAPTLELNVRVPVEIKKGK